jgi:hypothetical protein
MCLSLVNPQDLPPRRGKQIKTDQPVRINSRDRAGTRDEKNLRNFSLGATTLTGVERLARRNTVNAVGMATQSPHSSLSCERASVRKRDEFWGNFLHTVLNSMDRIRLALISPVNSLSRIRLADTGRDPIGPSSSTAPLATSARRLAALLCPQEYLLQRPPYHSTPRWPRPGWRLPHLLGKRRQKVLG